jgi:hypothetical protein
MTFVLAAVFPHILHSILLWFHTEYLPVGQPFYMGQVWGNVFVVFVAAPLAFIWAKTKYWPLHIIVNTL